MTTRIYKPSGAGGEFQIHDGTSWKPLLGVSDWNASGGARETTQTETLDGGVETSVGQAGPKDISFNLNPSFFNAQYRKLLRNSLYGQDTVRLRYRVLANVSNVATGGTGHGVSIKKLEEGIGNESELSFEATDGISKTALDAIKDTSELGILVTGSDTAVGSSDRTETAPAKGKFFIVRWDAGTSKAMASEWNGEALAADITTKDGWVLMRYGIAFEYVARMGDGNNPNVSAGQPITESLTFNQVNAQLNVYPITKAAT